MQAPQGAFIVLGGSMRAITPVACAVLFNEKGQCLINSRPQGKPFAGWWEFPGGKMEAGESVEETVRRELREELGLDVKACAPWVTLVHEYPHAVVKLHFVRSWNWSGVPQSREKQQFGFFDLDQWPSPILKASEPIASWLRLPKHWLRIESDVPDLSKIEKRTFDGVMLGAAQCERLAFWREKLAATGIVQFWVEASASQAIQEVSDGVYAKAPVEHNRIYHERYAFGIGSDDWTAFKDSGALFAIAPDFVQVGSSAWQRLLEENPVPLYATSVRVDDEKFLRPHGAQGWIETI